MGVFCGVVTVVVAVSIIIFWFFAKSRKVSAREGRLRPLAEPLALRKGPAVRHNRSAKNTKTRAKNTKIMATENAEINFASSTYLQRVYSRHMARELENCVSTYLHRVYARTVA